MFWQMFSRLYTHARVWAPRARAHTDTRMHAGPNSRNKMQDLIPASLIPATVILLTGTFWLFEHLVGGSQFFSGPPGWGPSCPLQRTGYWFQTREWESPAGLSLRRLGHWPEPFMSAVPPFLAVPQCSLGNHRGRGTDLWPCCSRASTWHVLSETSRWCLAPRWLIRRGTDARGWHRRKETPHPFHLPQAETSRGIAASHRLLKRQIFEAPIL